MNSSKCPPNVMLVFLAILNLLDTRKYLNMLHLKGKAFNQQLAGGVTVYLIIWPKLKPNFCQ